ncbi:tail fiber protein [Aquimarina litoralis]|uniref:tail fiber protein n=1 Tax=Aquimarina litoralis TaxID=584605 RepID=UPI001C5782F3|nr:tail fiber protein [Aquimarina litoralis]
MKRKLLTSFFIAFLTMSTVMSQSSASEAGIAIQGIARNADNTAITDDSVNLTFELYYFNASNLEEAIYSETTTVDTDAFGVFSHVIDPGSANNAIIANNLAYLRISEGTTIISDEKLKHVPYAIAANNGVPTGAIMPFIGTSVPDGWVLCNGQSLTSTPGSANLIALLGSNNAPDLQGMFLRGTGTSPVNGEDGPSLQGTQDDTFEAHTHNQGTLATSTAGAHNHNDSVNGFNMVLKEDGKKTLDGSDNDSDQPNLFESEAIATDGDHTHNISGNTGSTGGTETRPVNYGVNYIIKL